MARYTKFRQGSWRKWSQWQTMGQVTHVGCCDCGLVHSMRFKLDKNGILWMSVRRHITRTEARRKQVKHKFVPRKSK